MNCKEKAKDLYRMMDDGKIFEALDKYYADDCQIIEKPTGQVRNGKEAQRKAIVEWFEMIKENHENTTGFITSDEEAGVSMVQSTTDVTMHQGGRFQMDEVAVQTWNDAGKIIKEEFYYQLGPPPQME